MLLEQEQSDNENDQSGSTQARDESPYFDDSMKQIDLKESL